MRRKQSPSKPWLARLFSAKSRPAEPAVMGEDEEQKPSEPAPAVSRAPVKRMTPEEVLALAKQLGPAKRLPSAEAPNPAPAPAPARSADPPSAPAPPARHAAPRQKVPQEPAPQAVQGKKQQEESPKSPPPQEPPPLSDDSSESKSPPDSDTSEAPLEKSRVPAWLKAYWLKAGGGSLVTSLAVHLALLVVASFIVTSTVAEPHIDFLPGGGSKAGQEASDQLAHQMQTKKRTALNRAVPAQRLVTQAASAIALPDLPMDEIPLPEIGSTLGGMMSSAGFGSAGAGGGFGSGMGIGGRAGKSFKPIVFFGKNLNARSMAVILDVSGSMTPHLTKVIDELDRVAKGSPVVLYVGCGVAKPPMGVKLNDATTETRRPGFKAFWENDHGPEKEVYAIMSKRPYTYYIKSQGIQYAWISLLTEEVRHAEALYWFSDFQDHVEDDQMESVLTNLKRRQQKLYIHASENGSAFDRVKDQLCIPSGGFVIQDGK